MITTHKIFITIAFTFTFVFLKSNNIPNEWTDAPIQTKVFIENLGQYNNSDFFSQGIDYCVQGEDNIFFTKSGLVFQINEKALPLEEIEEKCRNGEELEEKQQYYYQMNWVGANPDAYIEVTEKQDGYFTFADTPGIRANGYKTLTYKNIYSGIDIKYEFYENKGGVKYSIIAQPGADISQVKMQYNVENRYISENSQNDIIIETPVGNIIDRSPAESFAGNTPINCSFKLTENIVSFIINENIDSNEQIIIDPWTTVPSSLGTDQAAYDVDVDFNNNVYVSGGTRPWKTAKYSPDGTLLWTYTWPNNWSYYTELTVIPTSGSVFIGEGFSFSDGPKVMKLTTNGDLDFMTDPLPGAAADNTQEIWVMFYNYCTHQLIGFGGSTSSSNNMQIFPDTLISGNTAHNFNGSGSVQNDIADAIMDDEGNFYALVSTLTPDPAFPNNPDHDGMLEKSLAPDYNTMAYSVNSTFILNETTGIPGDLEDKTVRLNAMALNMHHVFAYDGGKLGVWSKENGNLIASIDVNNYPSGDDREYGGIAVDECNNIYVGGSQAVHVYNFDGSNINYVSDITNNISGDVHDIVLNSDNNELIVCGTSFITSTEPLFCEITKELILTVSDAACGPNGTISIDSIIGLPPVYQYEWSTGATTPSISDLSPGEYSVTVSSSSCTYGDGEIDTTVTIIGGSELTVSIDSGHVSCANADDGFIAVTPQNGSAPYTYNWSNNGSDSIITDLQGGNYFVTIEDANGCTAEKQINILEPEEIEINFTDINYALCPEGCTGEALASADGGNPEYLYQWENGDSTAFSNNLCSGVNHITVTDSMGCTSTNQVNISAPQPIEATVSSTDPLCFGEAEGSIEINATGGTPQLKYNIGSGWSDNDSFINLNADTFYVSVKDANGCTIEDIEVIINQPEEIIIDTVLTTDILCAGNSNGAINAVASGGTGDLNYSIDGTDYQETGDFENLTGGLYNLLVMDSNQCLVSENVFISNPAPIEFTNLIIDPIICHGESGGLRIITQGGTGSLEYSINGGVFQTSNEFENLLPGSYLIEVKDENNCTNDTTVTITEPEPIIIIEQSTEDALCFGDNSGSIHVSAEGGTGNLYYSLYGSVQDSGVFTDLLTGTYVIKVFDDNNCSIYTDSLVIEQPTQIITETIKTDVVCHDDCNGTATITAEGGGSSTYGYTWSSGGITDSINNLCPGKYYVTVNDYFDCTTVDSVTINNVPAVTLQIAEEFKTCVNEEIIIHTNISNATSPITYLINNEEENPPFVRTHNQGGTYTYEVQAVDARGCISNPDICNVNVYPPVEAELMLSEDSICPGEHISIYPITSGGEEPYWFYDMDGNSVSMPVNMYPENSQTITFSVKDNICPAVTTSAFVFVHQFPPIVIQSDKTAGCVPLTVSFIEASSNNNFSYEWDFNDESGITSSLRNPTHTFKNPGVYDIEVSVLSPEMCRQDESINNMITVHPRPTARFHYTPNLGNVIEDPEISFTNTSTDDYFNLWAFGDGDSSSVENPIHLYRNAGEYTVTLITESQYGCLDTAYQNLIIEDEYTFYTPNAVIRSANKENSIFRPFGYGIDTKNGYSMSIYDRWGELIFHTSNWHEGWDTRVKSGAKATVGTYSWIINFRDLSGNSHTEYGAVTIIK